MAFLPGFEYDVFLSYGWSGNQLPTQGDRAWIAEIVRRLSERLRTKLGQSTSIYFDVSAPANGPLANNLSRAIESSALLLFSVSPGSCRPNSWCAFEAQSFVDRAHPIASPSAVLTREERLLKLVVETVDSDRQPESIRDVIGRRLHVSPSANILDDLRSDGCQELDLLTYDIAKLLNTAKGLLERRFERFAEVVFLSADSYLNHARLRDLRRNLELNGYRTVTAAPIPGEDERHFRERTEAAMRMAMLSVHLIGDSSGQLPEDWTRTPAAWQIRYSLRRSRDNEQYSVYLWEDPDATAADKWALAEIQGDQCLTKGDHHIKDGRGFEYLVSNLNSRLIGRTKLQQPAVIEGDQGPLMLIETKEEDVEDAGRLVADPLRKRGFRVKFAVPTGKGINPTKRKQKNREHYQQADRHLVYFGRGTWLWVEDTCDDMRGFLRGDSKGLVVLGPPPGTPPGKQRFEAERFRTIPHDLLINTSAGAF